MPRYECVVDNARKFWEVELNGATFTTRAGLVGTKGEAREFSYPTPDKAKAACDALVKSKLGLGYQLVEAPSAENGAGLWHASNPELEAAILRDRDDKSAWGVYADWLVSQGDLRGELIARAKNKKAHAAFLEENEDALFFDVLPHLQGMAARRSAKDDEPGRPEVSFDWRNGLVDHATVRVSDYDGDTVLADLLQKVLALPVTQFLRGLTLQIGVYQEAQDFTDALEVFMASPRARMVRSLELLPDHSEPDDEWDGRVNKPSWGSLEALSGATLETLVVEGTNGHVGALSLPDLERLSLEGRSMTRENLDDLVRAKLPRLTSLDVSLTSQEVLLEPASRIASGDAFPKLTRLALIGGNVPDLLPALLFGRLLPKLEQLSLRSAYLGEAGVELLLKERERFAHLKRLVLPSAWEVEARRVELLKLCKRVTWTRPRGAGDDDAYDDTWE